MKIDIILMSIAAAYFWVYRLGWWWKLKLRFKPFDCDVCLSFWFTCFGCYFTELAPLYCIGNGFIAAVLCPIIVNFITPKQR